MTIATDSVYLLRINREQKDVFGYLVETQLPDHTCHNKFFISNEDKTNFEAITVLGTLLVGGWEVKVEPLRRPYGLVDNLEYPLWGNEVVEKFLEYDHILGDYPDPNT